MMYIYNVTTQVEPDIHEEWLQWMQHTHIPEVIQTGCFSGGRLLKLLETDETEGFTYTVQYAAPGKADYNRYVESHAASLRASAINKWGNKIISFRSLMEVVN